VPTEMPPNNKIFRIVRGWFEDRDFQNVRGHPRKLALTGENSFIDVVRRYAGDVTPQSAARMLTQAKLANREHGKIYLTKLAYVQRSRKDIRHKQKSSEAYLLFRLLSDSFVGGPRAGVVFFERATVEGIGADVAPIFQARVVRTMRTSLDRVAVIDSAGRQQINRELGVAEQKSRLHAFVCVVREAEAHNVQTVRVSKRHLLTQMRGRA
jgi:hypothetical protein